MWLLIAAVRCGKNSEKMRRSRLLRYWLAGLESNHRHTERLVCQRFSSCCALDVAVCKVGSHPITVDTAIRCFSLFGHHVHTAREGFPGQTHRCKSGTPCCSRRTTLAVACRGAVHSSNHGGAVRKPSRSPSVTHRRRPAQRVRVYFFL